MDIYLHLNYREYKEVEAQCKAFAETAHTTVDGYYHKSFRLEIGGATFEFHGPAVKAAERLV